VSSWTTAIRDLLLSAATVEKVSNSRAMEFSGTVDSTDEAVMRRLQAGDKQALGIIYDRYSRLILTIGLRILKDVSEAQELLQEVFLQLFQNSSDFDATKGTLRSWLVQIAYSRGFNKREYLSLRRFYDYCNIDEVLEGVASDFSAEEFGIDSELRTLIHNALQKLTPPQTATLEMFLEGYSLREISTRLNETLGNTRNHYYRGVEKLREMLRQPASRPQRETE